MLSTPRQYGKGIASIAHPSPKFLRSLRIPIDLVGAGGLPPGKVIAAVSRFPLKYAAAAERRPPMLECQVSDVSIPPYSPFDVEMKPAI